jgi:hypothetical protein
MDTMKPDELREWAHAIRDVLQDFLPNRDSWVWAVGVAGESLAGSPEPRTVFLPPPLPMPPNVAIVPKDGGQ